MCGRSSRGRKLWLAILAGAVALLATACGDEGAGPSPGVGHGVADGVKVVATTTILGDIAEAVVGDNGVVEVLIPVGVDPHDYQASSKQIATLARADLVVANGLGLEEGLLDALESAAADGANVFEVAPLLDPLPFDDSSFEAASSPERVGGLDPHVWMDPIRMADAARVVASELMSVAPSIDWSISAERYADGLMEADDQVTAVLKVVSAPNRKLVTNHDSLGYLAARYDFEVVGTVIPGGTTLGSPSSSDLADLVEIVDREDVPAIFAETTEPSLLAEAVAAELGQSVVVVDLYTGSLGEPGTAADSLVGMWLVNADRIATALS